MINELTPEQILRFPEFIKKWTDIGLSCEPANRSEVEAGVEETYKIAGLEKPKIVWCESPLSAGLTRAIILNLEKNNEWKEKIEASVRDSVMASVRDSVMASVRASVWDSVWDGVWDGVETSVRASVMASVWDSGYGQHDANWVGFYSYFKEVCLLDKQTQKLSGIEKITKNGGWWLPHKNICWCSERHNTLLRDDQGRLHSSNKPALSYPDGFSIYAIHGVRVPEKYILTQAENINVEDVLKESNAEVRMAVISKVGFQKFKEKIPHIVVSAKHNNELLEFELGDEKVRGLLVRWTDKFADKQTILPVPKTREEFLQWRGDEDDLPDDINDCEQVRISTFPGLIKKARAEAGANWMQAIEFVQET